MPINHKFIVYWDQIGLDGLVEIDQDLMYQDLFDRIASEKTSNYRVEISRILRMMLLRAQANLHRNPEIYVFETHDIDQSTMLDVFASNAQNAADLIREFGHKIYDGRQQHKVNIT